MDLDEKPIIVRESVSLVVAVAMIALAVGMFIYKMFHLAEADETTFLLYLLDAILFFGGILLLILYRFFRIELTQDKLTVIHRFGTPKIYALFELTAEHRKREIDDSEGGASTVYDEIKIFLKGDKPKKILTITSFQFHFDEFFRALLESGVLKHADLLK